MMTERLWGMDTVIYSGSAVRDPLSINGNLVRNFG